MIIALTMAACFFGRHVTIVAPPEGDFLWKDREALIRFGLHEWNVSTVFRRTAIVYSSQRAVVVTCQNGLIGVRVLDGETRHEYGWLTEDEVR